MLENLKALVPDQADLAERAQGFLIAAGMPATAAHCAAVADESRRIAAQYGLDQELAWAAGMLHDISVVVPNDQRVVAAEERNVDILPEERLFPMILHQKLSVVVAAELFGVRDAAVLSAIGCHTTLKAGASEIDKVVFVGDKIAWDQPGRPPWLELILDALTDSLDAAALVYLSYLWEQRETLPVLHPWAAAAYHELVDRVGR